MTSKIKYYFEKNYELFFCILLLLVIFLIAVNPNPYMVSTFDGLKIWATIVLPSLFCFMILTKLLIQNKYTNSIFSLINYPFKKIYQTSFGGYIFLMSIISGYPLGCKLISEFYNSNQISYDEAKILTSFCSTSGPMFIIGSLSVGMFNSSAIGLRLLLVHIVSALLNGIIYKTKTKIDKKIENKNILLNKTSATKQTLNEIMLDTIVSSFMVGGFICLSFTLINFLSNFKIIDAILNLLNMFIPNSKSIIDAILSGMIELTNGCVKLSTLDFSRWIFIALSGLLAFGGLSIHLQSQVFLSKCKIKYSYFLLTKTTQAIIACVVSAVFSMFLF